MEERKKRPIPAKAARRYAKTVLEREWHCAVKKIRLIGGGSFGFVYEAVLDKAPYTVVIKGFRTGNMCEREAGELRTLGRDSLVKVPQVYFTLISLPAAASTGTCRRWYGGSKEICAVRGSGTGATAENKKNKPGTEPEE